MFGAENQNTNNNSSDKKTGLFGNSESLFGNQQSLFGKSSNQDHNKDQGGSSLFGQTDHNDSVLFGKRNKENKESESKGGLFGQSSLFGQKQNNDNNNNGSLFGSSSNNNTDKSNQNQGGLFSGQTSSLFGGDNNNNKKQETTNLFGGPSLFSNNTDGENNKGDNSGRLFSGLIQGSLFQDSKNKEHENKWRKIYALLKYQFREIIDKRATWKLFYKYTNFTQKYQVKADKLMNLLNLPLQQVGKIYKMDIELDLEIQEAQVQQNFQKLAKIFSSLKNLKELSLKIYSCYGFEEGGKYFNKLLKLLPQLKFLAIINSQNLYSGCDISYIKQGLQKQTSLQKLGFYQSVLEYPWAINEVLKDSKAYTNLRLLNFSLSLDFDQFLNGDMKECFDKLQQFLKKFSQIQQLIIQFQSSSRLNMVDNQVIELFDYIGETTHKVLDKLVLYFGIFEQEQQNDIHLLQKLFVKMDSIKNLELVFLLKNIPEQQDTIQEINGQSVPEQLNERGISDILKSILHLKNLAQMSLTFQVEQTQKLFESQREFVISDEEVSFFKNYLQKLPKLKEFKLNGFNVELIQK